jgi:hypothetical protein
MFQMLEAPFFWSLVMCPPSSNRQNLVVIVHVLFFSFSHGGHPKVICKTIDLCSAEASPPSVPLSKRATTRATPGAWHCTCCRVFWTGRPGSTGCGFGQQLGKASSFIAKRTKSIAYRHDNFRFLMVNGSLIFHFFFSGSPVRLGMAAQVEPNSITFNAALSACEWLSWKRWLYDKFLGLTWLLCGWICGQPTLNVSCFFENDQFWMIKNRIV